MKLKINREIAIGLSVLLALLVILGAVAVHRFFHREEIVAMEEEKRSEEPRVERKESELDWPRKPELPPAAAIVDRDHMPSLGGSEHRNDLPNELKKDVQAIAKGLIHPEPRDVPKTERTESKHSKIDPVPAPFPPDGRYSPEAMSGGKEWKSPTTNATSMVVSVGAEDRADAVARPPDRNPGELHAHQGEQDYRNRGSGTESFGAVPDARQFVPRDGRGAGMPIDPQAARNLEKKQAAEERRPLDQRIEEPRAGEGRLEEPRAEERQIEERRAAERQAAAALPSRYGNESTFSPSPAVGPPNYAGAQIRDTVPNNPARDGYPPENSLRPGGEFAGRTRAENRLREDGKYEVQPNDSYWTISERVYGSGAYFRALAEQNRGKAARPDRLPPGLVISTPPVAQLEKDFPDLCPRPSRREVVRNRAAAVTMTGTAGGGRTYIVQEGDTLSSIARNELGKVSRWAEIYQLNRDAIGKDFDYLTPGMRLVLPIRDVQSGERTTRRDDRDVPFLR